MARATRKQTPGLLRGLPKQVDRVQADIEKTLRRTWKRTLSALPTRTQKAVKNLTRQVEKQAADLERRRKRAIKTAETRRKRLIAEVEARATKTGKSVVERLDLVSRNDLDRLSRRIAQLERRVRVKPAGKIPAKAAA